MAYNRVTMGRIVAGELQIGVPIPYSVYDEHYNLLLREGVTLTNQRQLDALVDRGLYRVELRGSIYETLLPDGNPIDRFDLICRELNSLLVGADRGGEDFPARILSISARLGDLCERHAEACLAAILYDRESRYAVRHMVHVAIVSRLIAGLIKLDVSDRLSLVAAALTMNLSIFELQNEIHAQGDRPFSEADRETILRHPETTVDRLQALGVRDQVWLEVVAQHHEAFDGGGYPKGLVGDSIVVGARVLNLADNYTARLRQRADRDARLPNESLREIFVGAGKGFDPTLTQVLVKAVGLFPPGLVVELESGEIGVVTRLGRLVHAPEVYVVVSARSNLLAQPSLRHTDVAPNRIHHAIAPGAMRFRFDPLQFWSGPRSPVGANAGG